MPHATENLSRRIAEKHALLGQLRELGSHQAALIQSGDMTQLLKLLAAKQRLLAALQTVERQLDPFRDDDPESRVWASPEHRQRCAKTAADCEALLCVIVEQERESESQMKLRRDEAAARLQGAHSAAEVRQAYAAQPFSTSSQLDLSQG